MPYAYCVIVFCFPLVCVFLSFSNIYFVVSYVSLLGDDVCMIKYSKSMNQPGKVANPACDQLNRENEHFPVRVRA